VKIDGPRSGSIVHERPDDDPTLIDLEAAVAMPAETSSANDYFARERPETFALLSLPFNLGFSELHRVHYTPPSDGGCP